MYNLSFNQQFIYPMHFQQFKDLSITLHVLGFTSQLIKPQPESVYHVAVQSSEKTLYGINHKGSSQNWKNAFAIKLSQYKQNEIFMTLFVNEIELGKATIQLLQIYQSVYLENRRQYLMKKSEKNVGYVDIRFVKSMNVDTVGGLPLPRLSFRPDHIQNLNRVSIPKQVIEKQEKVKNQPKRNLLCCQSDTVKEDEVMIPNHAQIKKKKTKNYLQ